MTPEEAIKYVQKWKTCVGTTPSDLAAINILCDHTRECLELRKQPSIEELLDEIDQYAKTRSQLWFRSDKPGDSVSVIHIPLLSDKIRSVRAKNCREPQKRVCPHDAVYWGDKKTEPKPTMKGIVRELIAAVYELGEIKGALDIKKWMDRLQDQLKEVEE